MRKKLYICHTGLEDGNCNLMFTLDPYQAAEQKKKVGTSVFSISECDTFVEFPSFIPPATTNLSAPSQEPTALAVPA